MILPHGVPITGFRIIMGHTAATSNGDDRFRGMNLSNPLVSMNKAFVRESDSDVRHCPFCGSLGQAVERVTLDAWVQPEFRGQIGDSAMFCIEPQCEVAYF